MTTTTNENLQDNQINEETDMAEKMTPHGQVQKDEPQAAPGNFREASYVVLFIAAVFVINAMETGSYRTPWPVAIITSILGIGLFIYSWYLQSRPKS